MNKLYFVFAVLGTLFLSGCVSGERLARNTPFASGNNSFYRDGVQYDDLFGQSGNISAGKTTLPPRRRF